MVLGIEGVMESMTIGLIEDVTVPRTEGMIEDLKVLGTKEVTIGMVKDVIEGNQRN